VSVALSSTPLSPASALAPIRVMIVDDSMVVRGLIERWLESEGDFEITASLRSGREAVDRLDAANPDVVVLDIEMPDLDGIATLPLLLKIKPNLAVVVASAVTRHDAEMSLKALSLGALDCIPKPDSASGVTVADFRRDLISKVRELGLRAKATPPILRVALPVFPPAKPASGPALRPFPRVPPRVLLIGSSTGGPQALSSLVPGLASVSDRAPILITQHMPPTFSMILAEHLARVSGRPVREAEDGEPVLSGGVYVAPGGRHMRVIRGGDGSARVALDNGAPVHFCRPAVDPLFSSAAGVWGAWVLGIILTGMGNDGTRGAGDIVAAGGGIIAQDEASSVVWGMPGSAVQAKLCSAILPLGDIAAKVTSLFSGERA
jgi:two-component system, chemotaxis family, protein-glutamate methylesterase/glutaminase